MTFDYELVGKIGSMALIRKEDNDIDYNIFSRLGAMLRPGMIWVSSGATEIGRLDYMKRIGHELAGNVEQCKADYAAQGQAILMATYRQFISPQYSVRQVLVEHQHFNDPEKREFIRQLLLRCKPQGAVPIVNYNDSVSFEENRRMELMNLRGEGAHHVVECVDNDETAAVICTLVRARRLVILSSVDGIYADPTDPSTRVPEISGKDAQEVIAGIEHLQQSCVGASRPGANGARAKLEFIKEPVAMGTTVYIAHARHRLDDILSGNAPCTRIGVR
nr:uridylate kinase [bacterium]